jgi:hypothetical protein
MPSLGGAIEYGPRPYVWALESNRVVVAAILVDG